MYYALSVGFLIRVFAGVFAGVLAVVFAGVLAVVLVADD
jgi:hypothetical protein